MINSQTHKKQVMKTKKEMNEIILKELNDLWNEYEQFNEVLGADHEATQRAATRWASINELVIKLGL